MENGLREQQDGEHFGAVKVKDDTPQSIELLLLMVAIIIILIIIIILANDDVDTRAEIISTIFLCCVVVDVVEFFSDVSWKILFVVGRKERT